MVIDINRTVIRTQLRRFITLLVFAGIVIFILLTGDRNNMVLGMNKYSWGLVVGIIYLAALIAESFLELNYIYFSDEGKNIMLRYFSMSVLNRRKNSIEIPKEDFAGYEITSSLWGYKKSIRLMQRFKKETARYPAVSLSGMTSDEVNLMLKTLSKYQ